MHAAYIYFVGPPTSQGFGRTHKPLIDKALLPRLTLQLFDSLTRWQLTIHSTPARVGINTAHSCCAALLAYRSRATWPAREPADGKTLGLITISEKGKITSFPLGQHLRNDRGR